MKDLNSLTPGKSGSDYKSVISRHMSRIKFTSTCETALRWMPEDIFGTNFTLHYNDVKTGAIASQITSLMIVFLTVYSDADQRKHQSSVSLAFVRGIHRGPVNSPHKWPVTRKCFHLMTSSWVQVESVVHNISYKQRVLMHRHQGWNVRHGLCHIYMRYIYIYELFIAFVCFVVCSLL